MDLGESYPLFDKPEYDGLISALEDCNISTAQLLVYTDQEVARKCARSINEVIKFRKEFITHARQQLSPPLTRADELYPVQCADVISTGDERLDLLLGGGVRTKTLTEFVGEAGCGKSHVLTQLAFKVQLPVEEGGLERAAIVVSTETPLRGNRLQDFEAATGGSAEAIVVYHCKTYREMEQCLLINVPYAVQQFDVGLVVLDSIAHPFRGMTTRETQNLIAPLADSLRFYAQKLNFAVVTANQITSAFPVSFPIDIDRDPLQVDYQTRWHSGWTTNTVTWKTRQAHEFYEHPAYEPALRPYCGHAWSSAVDVRVAMKRDRHRNRRFQLVYSPWAAPAELNFEINTDGVSATDELNFSTQPSQYSSSAIPASAYLD